MKTKITNSNLPSSLWQTLHQIDTLINQPLLWAERIEKINGILIDELEIDAIWLLTIDPLPPTACGAMRTPLTIAPNAQVHVVDNAPPVTDNWPVPDSLLGQVIYQRIPRFIEPNGSSQADQDLGDVFFGTFDTIPSAIIPLTNENQSVGALILGSRNLIEMPLEDNAQNMFTYLGKHVGTSLHNTYLVERSQRQANALKTLSLIGNAITSSLDIDDVLERTMAGINEVLEVEAGSLLLVDRHRNELYFRITLRGENKEITSYRLGLDEGIAGWVVSNNQPVISNAPRSDKRFSSKIDEAIKFETRSVLCVPLIVQGQPIGALEVLNKRTGFFTSDDQALLVSMAASVGVALNNATLYDEVAARARRSEIINEITTAINTGRGLTEIGKYIHEQLARLIHFDHMSLSLLDDSKQNLQQWILTEHGGLAYSRSVIPLANSSLEKIIDSQEAQIFGDISNLSNGKRLYSDDEILLEDAVVSKMSIPLSAGKSPYGSLNLGCRQPNAYTAAELSLVQQLIPQISVAIEKSRTIDAIEQHNTELKRLNHLSEMLVSTTDMALIIDTVLSMIPRLLPGNIQGILLAGEQGLYLGVAIPFDFSRTDEVIEDIRRSFAEINEQDSLTEIVYSKVLGGNLPVPPDWQAETVLHLPIIAQLGTLGLLYIASGEKETLSDEVWQTFSLIASQISVAVQNARLFKQVEQERARLAAILASSTDAVLVVDRDGRIVLDNPTAWEVMEVEESQRDKLLAKATPNETLIEFFEDAIHDSKKTGEIVLSDGRTFFANLSTVSASNLGVVGSVATMQDVSHFKEVNQLKSDFVNSVSHDLRSPLSGILIAAHLMPQMGPLNETQNELLDTIETRVNIMSHLIENLLDVGKIEAGIDMEMESWPLAPIIDEVIRSLVPQATEKSIELIEEIASPSPIVMVNPTRIKQVIHNLVANAIKYTPKAGRVTIKLFEKDDETRLQVSDTGIGIPASDQPHIFEKFYRVRGEHVEGIKGTGLGLSIAQGIVEKHKGRIWLESVFGEGTTFTVALPSHRN